jgi:two-component system, chemotaxis family, CheB/CheR fusion protein
MSSSRIVGIGASAGGLESLEHLFSALPPDTGMAFIVVQHLSPDFRSLMDELIARRSTMPVTIVDDGMEVQPNHIYLLPPRKEMVIRDHRLVLTDKPNGLSLPIDLFFRSLAQDVGGVWLSC